jgi:hypothetical protein
MRNAVSVASLIMFATLGTACLDHTAAPWEPGGGVYGRPSYMDGAVSSPAIEANNVTVAARDVGGDGTIVNSETYTSLDHGFKLDLPGGRYAIDITDAVGHVIATYPDVTVDGDVTVDAPQAAQ